ncbi:restriction endonuclease subunit S [Oceanobacter sp. 3_MG-2023]|uniref:restriction endonuclease subunit S n=1 Tax=Oceanobacter sp. 3_MG-2023 TaxID=3062622 RepID=UPI002736C92F|nr:restriction endonuclease subunit S [Oceanobacter sp. 3_MG-2023]MDP2506141.1 restriction endonuclease subunit S [Oceanobacter sp. 3_MG-2023]
MTEKRYIAYREYKTSKEIPFSSIPIDWTFKALKWELSAKSGTNTKSETGKFPLWGANGVIGKSDSCISISKCTLVGRVGSAGEVNYAEGQFGVSDNVLIIKSNIDDLPRFNFYLLKSLNLEDIVSKNAQPLITASNILNQIVGLPRCAEERNQIANFLDHETAKIDTLIDKQQQLIKLLKEKRQAVISHAVTKGLNPDAPMKDSGIEWLGEVPEHWITKSYRYSCLIYRGKFGHRPRNDPSFYDGEYPFIQTGDIARAGKVITSYKQTLNEKGKDISQLFPSGTLVMAIAANIGDTAILGFEAYAPDSVVGFKPQEDIELEFLRYSLLAALPALEQTSTQSTQANLNIDRIGAVKAAFPPTHEQYDIISFLDDMLNRYDVVEEKSMNLIAYLKERRTALISAAVTGKIDVRNWKPENPQPSMEANA